MAGVRFNYRVLTLELRSSVDIHRMRFIEDRIGRPSRRLAFKNVVSTEMKYPGRIQREVPRSQNIDRFCELRIALAGVDLHHCAIDDKVGVFAVERMSHRQLVSYVELPAIQADNRVLR